jgi:hypothetical protein
MTQSSELWEYCNWWTAIGSVNCETTQATCVFAQGYSSHLRNKDRCFKVDCNLLLISHCLAPLQTLSYFISVCAINQNVSNEVCGCLLSTWLHLSLNSLSNSVSSMRLPVQIATCSNDLRIDHQMAPTDQLSTGAPCNSGLIDDSDTFRHLQSDFMCTYMQFYV